MKFSWKVFLSIISLTMLTFSVGGYFLIQSSFQSSLRQTAEMSYQENNIFRATLGGFHCRISSGQRFTQKHG